MIGLLIDAAIAVVVVLDRACAAVERSRHRAASPAPVDGVTPAGTGESGSATSAGGHLNSLRHEPLVWGEHILPHN